MPRQSDIKIDIIPIFETQKFSIISSIKAEYQKSLSLSLRLVGMEMSALKGNTNGACVTREASSLGSCQLNSKQQYIWNAPSILIKDVHNNAATLASEHQQC